LFAGELSAHLFFEEIGGFECPLLALYYLMDEWSHASSVSAAVTPYLKYHKPPLKKYTVADRDEVQVVFDRISKHYKDYTLDYTDGVGVYGDDFWFVIRASNTEPILRMCMEADTEAEWKERIQELESLLS
jgi:phosphomannomutase